MLKLFVVIFTVKKNGFIKTVVLPWDDNYQTSFFKDKKHTGADFGIKAWIVMNVFM